MIRSATSGFMQQNDPFKNIIMKTAEVIPLNDIFQMNWK